mmetsp:Transcript_5090/g.14780  ORF Transcript_5090/g.14780 Transcript_5090/m.14780 type:complete len:308 (+) Transcript_5090:3157-4080(+)
MPARVKCWRRAARALTSPKAKLRRRRSGSDSLVGHAKGQSCTVARRTPANLASASHPGTVPRTRMPSTPGVSHTSMLRSAPTWPAAEEWAWSSPALTRATELRRWCDVCLDRSTTAESATRLRCDEDAPARSMLLRVTGCERSSRRCSAQDEACPDAGSRPEPAPPRRSAPEARAESTCPARSAVTARCARERWALEASASSAGTHTRTRTGKVRWLILRSSDCASRRAAASGAARASSASRSEGTLGVAWSPSMRHPSPAGSSPAPVPAPATASASSQYTAASSWGRCTRNRASASGDVLPGACLL